MRAGRTFYRYLFSSLILLALPLLFFGGVYLRSVALTRDDITRIYSENLSRDGRVSDAGLAAIRGSAASFVYSAEVRSALAVGSEPTPMQTYGFAELQNKLREFRTAFPEVKQVYIYFPRGDFMLGDTGRFTSDKLGYMARTYFGTDAAELLECCVSGRAGLAVKETSGGMRLIYFMRLSAEAGGGRCATLIAELSPSLFAEAAAASGDFGERRLLCIDGALYDAALFTPAAADAGELEKLAGSGEASVRIDGEPCAAAYAQSGVSGLGYVSAVPVRNIDARSGYIVLMGAMYLSIYIAVGVALAYFFTRRNYRPLERILRELELCGERSKSEYELIENRFAAASAAEDALERSMDDVRAGYLYRLLRSGAAENAAAYGVDFGSDAAFALAVCEVIEYGDGFSAAGEVDDRTSEAVIFAVRNVVCELAEPLCRSYVFIGGETATCILSAPDFGTLTSALEALDAGIRSFFPAKLPVKVRFSRSRAADSVSGLPALRRELEEARRGVKDEMSAHSQTDAMLAYIGSHFCEQSFGLERAAEIFGLNPSYFSRRFKLETGVGFGEYVQALRFRRAGELLKDTGEPVARIVELVGYISVSSFTAAFKKAAGMSPAAYRKKYGANDRQKGAAANYLPEMRV